MAILPYPPSANRYWRAARGRVFVSKEAKDFKAKVRAIAEEQGYEPLEGPVSVTLEVYRPAKRGDLDNSIKVTLDSLKGIAFVDDAQVVRLQATRFDNKDNPCVVVYVNPSIVP